MHRIFDPQHREDQLEQRGLKEIGLQFLPSIYFGIIFTGAKFGHALGIHFPFSDIVILLAATAATFHVLKRQLPLQNIFGICVVIGIFSGATILVGKWWGRPFSPPFFNEHFRVLPVWIWPFLWILALVNGRGSASFLLQRLRGNSRFGWILLLASSLLAASFNLNVETRSQIFLTQFALAGIALVLSMPWFIDKKNVERKVDFQPWIIVLLLMLL